MEKLHNADKAKVKQLCAVCRIVMITKVFTKKNLKILRKNYLDATKNDNMAVEATEERNQNMNGRNDGDRDAMEEQNTNDVEQNTKHSNEEEMVAERNEIGHVLRATKEASEDYSGTESAHETSTVASKVLSAWKNEDVNFKVVDENDEKLELEENWARGVRTIGHHKRSGTKVESLAKVKTSEQSRRLKQKVRNKCDKEGV